MANMADGEKIDSILQMVKELAENDKRLEKGQKEIQDTLGTTNERLDILAVDANKNKADIRLLKSTDNHPPSERSFF